MNSASITPITLTIIPKAYMLWSNKLYYNIYVIDITIVKFKIYVGLF